MEKSVSVRVEDEASSSSWVVEMKKMLEDTSPVLEMARWKKHCIYRVPEFIKDRTNSKAYRPQFVSLGPLHHGEPALLPMEQHKRRAVLHMVKRARKPLEEFVAAIEEVADELEGAYNDLDDKWRGANRGSFVEMMVTDGCFLLELIRMYEKRGKDEDYAANDPVFSVGRFTYFWSDMRNDMIAMENQVPLVVMQRLLAVKQGTYLSAEEINSLILCLLERPLLEEEDMDKLGLHILDILHKSYCGVCPHGEGSDDCDLRTPCAVELSEAGIQFKKKSIIQFKKKSIQDVDFENGVLSMPQFELYDNTETIFLNLMAFEWLHPDAKPDVASYISFLDKIIESERDVALLRSEGLLENMIDSDKKVVEMFNTLTKLARWKRNKLSHVQWKVNAHCRKRRNKWRAIFVNTYLSNPWVFMSLVAAAILLGATLLQTVYTIVPFYKNG